MAKLKQKIISIFFFAEIMDECKFAMENLFFLMGYKRYENITPCVVIYGRKQHKHTHIGMLKASFCRIRIKD